MRYHESTEEIPEHVKRGRNNSSHIMVGCDGSCHHAIEGEIQHSKVHKKYVPHEFGNRPLI